mgnify:FL=1
MNERTNSILMVRPYDFGYNKQTSYDNYYQKLVPNTSLQALKEFDQMVDTLRNNGIDVHVFLDDNLNHTPDSVFPNNWISLHHTGEVCLFPMLARNRRLERKPEVFSFLEVNGFQINRVIDYSHYELENIFLEGTGSIILDRKNKIAYCSVSKRSNEYLFFKFCKDFEFLPIIFSSFQSVNNSRLPIYHTNVMMCLASDYVVICLDSIDNKNHKKLVINSIKKSGKELVEINESQVENFAGNMLELINDKGESVLIMSKRAKNSLNEKQIKLITKYSKIISSDIQTIEECGGGSARCMMTEIFLPKK